MCARWTDGLPRVLGFVVEKSFLFAGLFTGIPWLPLFLINDIVVTRIPNAVSWWQALRNHDLRRVTRPGIWQRPGDVITGRESSTHAMDLRGVAQIGREERQRTRGGFDLAPSIDRAGISLD